MPRPKKDCKSFSIRMEQATYDRLCNFCEESGQPKTIAVERAVTLYIDEYDKKQMLIEKTKE